MTRTIRCALPITLLTMFVGTTQCAQQSDAQSSKPMNIVFFLVDDLGWADVGCFGSSFYETPQIDRLCASGMKFTAR